jgi:tetratricopeptide (TPR) repeat protein
VASARSDDALSMFRCGTANARRNNYDEAIKDYAEAINRDQNLKSQKDIDYSHAFYQRGCRSRSRFDNSINSDDCRKNYESALSDFQKAMDLHPTKNRDAEREIQYLEEMLSERCSEPAVSSNGSGKASLAFAD